MNPRQPAERVNVTPASKLKSTRHGHSGIMACQPGDADAFIEAVTATSPCGSTALVARQFA